MTESSKLYKIDIENKKAYVKCDNIFEKEFLSNNCYSLLEESLNKTTNVDFSILFFTKDEQALVDNETSPILISTSISDGVNAKYTFADYVVSSKNKMLVQAAQSIVLRPNAGPYNPLFIHGGSGLGKTHLLHAIGNEIKVKMPHKKVKYISSEEFGDAVVNAMLKKEETTIQEKINQLKKNYQNYDILLLDDIQYISSRDKTKEIFFAILNNYIDDEKQIVITSDSSPEELSEFEDRFITRFKKGLTLSVSPPDVDTAKKIIQLKLKKIHMVEEEMLDDDVLEFIALNFSESVRELEGVINKLMF
jgi:chromosomal replication initiator protein